MHSPALPLTGPNRDRVQPSRIQEIRTVGPSQKRAEALLAMHEHVNAIDEIFRVWVVGQIGEWQNWGRGFVGQREGHGRDRGRFFARLPGPLPEGEPRHNHQRHEDGCGQRPAQGPLDCRGGGSSVLGCRSVQQDLEDPNRLRDVLDLLFA